MNTAEMAVAAANKRKHKEAENAQASQAALNNLELEHNQLTQTVLQTLKEMGELPGVTVTDSEIIINGRYFRVYVELVRGKFRFSDDSQEEEYKSYLIRWEDRYGKVFGGHSTVASFKESFANHMSMYL